MVKNNGIPVEVKKPFETVYELKNEIPTFEEFMKTYENDGNLNYDDLKGDGLGEVKGYGPCSDYRCYPSNPNACERDSYGNIIEFFYDLYTPCPAARCPDEQNKDKATHWVHNNSGCGNRGSLSWDKISNKLRIRCPDCFNTSHMKYHKFTCPAHPIEAHKDKFWWTSSMSFSRAFAVVYYNSGIPHDVYIQMLGDLRKPENQWPARADD